MAVFEPTEAEKAAASYLDWDDAELGKFTKHVGLMMAAMDKDADGFRRVTAVSCAMSLVSSVVDSNAAKLTLKLDGHTLRGEPTGDWVISIRRTKPALTSAQDEGRK